MRPQYEKREIHGESDLPKKNGIYFVKLKTPERQTELTAISFIWESNPTKCNPFWINKVDWYLQPISPTQPTEPISDEEIEKEAHKRSTFHVTGGVKPWDQTDPTLKERLINMAKWYRSQLQSQQVHEKTAVEMIREIFEPIQVSSVTSNAYYNRNKLFERQPAEEKQSEVSAEQWLRSYKYTPDLMFSWEWTIRALEEYAALKGKVK